MRALLQRHRRFFFAFTVAALVLRAFFVIKFPQVTPDSLLYADLAKNWLAHGIYGQSDPSGIIATFIRLPGYPAFLGAVFAVFGSDNLRAVFALQILIDLGTCFILADAARRCLQSDRAAKTAFALAALCPFLANYTAAVLTETLEVFATALALNLALAAMERKTSRGWVYCGIAVGTAIQLRPDGGLLAAAIGAYLLLRHRFAALLTLSLTVALCLTPWTLRNFHTFHQFQPLAPRYANTTEDPVPYGFNRWTKTWIADYVSTEELYWNEPGDEMDFDKLPSRAFDSQQQFDATQQIFDDYNANHEIDADLDARFAALAQERIHAAPLRYYVRLPLLRMADMWLRPRTELIPVDPRWWEFDDVAFGSTVAVSFGLINLFCIAAALIGLARRALLHTGLLSLFLLLRTLLLGTLENPEPRYTLECYPAIILAASAAFRRSVRSRSTTTHLQDSEPQLPKLTSPGSQRS